MLQAWQSNVLPNELSSYPLFAFQNITSPTYVYISNTMNVTADHTEVFNISTQGLIILKLLLKFQEVYVHKLVYENSSRIKRLEELVFISIEFS